MADEINAGVVRLDMNPYLKALDAAIAKTDDWTSHLRKVQEEQKRPWLEMAEAQQRYMDKLRAQVAQIDQARQVQRELNNVAAEYAATIRRLSQDRRDTTDIEKQKALSREIRQQKQELEKVRVEIRLNTQATADEQAVRAKLVDAEKQRLQQVKLTTSAAKDAAAAEREAARATKEQAQHQREAATAADKAARAAGVLGQLEQRLADLTERRAKATTRAEVKGYTQQIAGVKKELAELQGATSNGGSFLDGLIGKAGAAAAGFFALKNIVGAVKQGIADYGAVQGVENTFKALTGSANNGRREVGFLRSEVDRLGLDLVPTAQAYSGLYAAAKEANLPVATTRELFVGLTSAGRVLGKSQAEVESAIRAVEQMISKGTVSSQELKLQLGNALPGAFALAAKAAGLTTKELSKQLEQGKILANDFLPKFAKQLRDTYGAGTADAATAVTANMGRINTFLASQSAQLGALAAPVVAFFAKYVSGAESAAQRAERTADTFFRSAEANATLERSLPALLNRYVELQSSTDSNKQKQEELRQVINQLAAAVPGAVTAFDKYGVALGINEQAVNRFLKNNRKVAEELRQIGIRDAKENLKRIEEEQKQVEARLNSGEKVNGVRRLRGAGNVRIEGKEGRQVVTPGALLSQAESDAEYKKEAARAAELDAARRQQLHILADLRRGQRGATEDTKNAVKVEQGYILMLRARIKANQDLRDSINESAQSKDNPAGGGQARRDMINAEIKADEERLRLAEGREAKGAKQRENQLEAARRALHAKETKLQEAHDKSLLEQQRFNGELRAKEQLRQDLAEIAELEEQIKKAEQLVAKRGGKGAEADAKLSKEQQQLVNDLTADARRRFGETLAEIDRQTNARILELQRDSDAKELAQLRAKFDEEIRVAKLAQNERLQVELEGAKQRAEAELIRSQAARKIREEEQFRLNAIERGEKFTQQTIDVTADQSMSPELNAAKQENIFRKLLANAAVDIEKQKQRDILQTKIEAQEKLLALYANDTSDEALVIQDSAKTVLDGLRKQLDALNTDTAKNKPFNLLKALGVDEKHADELNGYLKEAKQSIFDSLNSIFQAEVNAAQKRIDARTQHINELQGQLGHEIELFKSGAASNIGSLRDQIEAEKAARKEDRKQRQEALNAQKTAQRAQLLLDSITQASNLATASTNIYAGTSKLDIIAPGVGVAVGTAIVGTLIGAFILGKIKALQAINQTGKGNDSGFFKGGFTGGTSIHEERGVVHGKEHVMDHKGTATYGDALLEPLRLGRPQDVDWRTRAMQDLLGYAPLPQVQALLPNYDVPRQMREEQRQAIIIQQQQNLQPLQDGLAKMEGRLGAIERHVAKTANMPQRVSLGNNEIMIFDGNNVERKLLGPRQDGK